MGTREVDSLLIGLAESLEAGASPLSIAQSPLLEDLGPAAASRLRRGLESGQGLAEILGSLGALPPAPLAILRAAEVHGGLPAGLRLVADRLAQARKDANRILLALAYPALLLLAAATVLPLPALFTGGFVAWARQSLPLAGAVVVAAVALAVFVRHPSAAVQSLRLRVALWLPVARTSIWYWGLADFAEVLGASLRAGVPVRAALPLAAGAAAHPGISGSGAALVARLDSGATLVDTLRVIPRFPRDLLAQVHSAEHAGTLDDALARIAAACRSRARRSTLVALGVLTAVVLAAVVVYVGYAIVSGFIDVMEQTDQAIEDAMRQR